MKERIVPESEGGAAAEVTAVAPEWMPAIDARLTRVGTAMLLIADTFFFAAFFFAFFYLRALNNDYSWLPAGTTHPTRAIGAVIVVLAVATALLYIAAMRNVGSLRGFLWLALVAGVLCVGLQLYEFRNLGFDPQQGGGYPSVFVGLKGSLTIQFAGALIWLITHISQSGPDRDLEHRRATAGSFGNFLLFLAGISLIAYLVLYFV